MARTRTAGTPETEPTFEQAMNELEELVHALEDGTLPLDFLVEKYERGMGLLKQCQVQLEVAQLRIEQITRRADGGADSSPLPAEPAASSRPASPSLSPPPASSSSDEIRLF